MIAGLQIEERQNALFRQLRAREGCHGGHAGGCPGKRSSELAHRAADVWPAGLRLPGIMY